MTADPDDRLLALLKAMAHPQRLRILRRLAAAGELSCGQLGEHLPLSQPAISHHLKILVDAGLVQVRRDAQHHFLSVDHAAVKSVGALLPARRRRARR